TFAVLSLGFHADVAVFRTAWFVESIVTQILVIFIIRTAKPVWSSRPHRMLAATSLGGIALALVLSLTPLGAFFGFVGLPLPILGVIAGISALYLASAEALKRFAMKSSPTDRGAHRKRRRLPLLRSVLTAVARRHRRPRVRSS
ncbi:MAG: cation transporting ATPase C-terminal domain-containing protein, partial [Devosia sp.]